MNGPQKPPLDGLRVISESLAAHRTILQRAMAEAAEAGFSLRQIGEATGMSHEGVRKALRVPVPQVDQTVLAQLRALSDALQPQLAESSRALGALNRSILEQSRKAFADGAFEQTRKAAEELGRPAMEAAKQIRKMGF